MATEFERSEKLFRGILPLDAFWKDNNTVSSAAFKIRNGEDGLSTHREFGRSSEECIYFMSTTLSDSRAVAIFNINHCNECEALAKHDPKDGNVYHTLVLGGSERPRLTKGQAKHLASKSTVVRLEISATI